MIPAQIFNDFHEQLVRSLPVKDAFFKAKLKRWELFSGDLEATVDAKSTRAEGATLFLKEGVEPFLDYEEQCNPFCKLLLAMDEFGSPLKELATRIKEKLKGEVLSAEVIEEVGVDTANVTASKMPSSVKRLSSGYGSMMSQSSLGESSQSSSVHSGMMVNERSTIEDKSLDSTRNSGENVKLTNFEDIDMEFAKMTKRIKEALISDEISVVSLMEQLCATSAVSNKKVPLFNEDDMFEKVNSIDEFWKRLSKFWSIIDYDLLRYVIKLSDCKKAQEIFEEFLARIDPSAIEDVDLVLHCKEEDWEGSPKPVLRIKVNAENCSLGIQQKVKQVVSEIYNVQKYSLHYKGIKKGCVELFYNISKAMMRYFLQFKISSDMWTKLSNCKISGLYINDQKLEIPSESINIPSKIYQWGDSRKDIKNPCRNLKLVQGAVLIRQIPDKSAKPTMLELNRYVLYIHAHKWKNIGMELGLEFDVLDEIESKHIHQNVHCFQKALNMWLKTISYPTWDTLEVAITNVHRAESGLLPVTRVFDVENICTCNRSLSMNNSESDGVSCVSQYDSGLGPDYELSSDYLMELYQLADHLRDKYISKRHTQYHNEKEQWPPNPLKIIVSIAMITYGNKEPIRQYILIAEYHRKGTSSMDQLITRNYDISPSKRQRLHDFRIIKSITEIFASDPVSKKNNPNKPPKSILIEGIPGVGKTTLAKEIAYRWASKDILNDVTILFLLFLRDPALQRINSLVELVEYVGGGYLNYEQCKSCANQLRYTKQICFVLDGYDEYSCSSQQGSFITKLIEREILPSSIVVITSRPTESTFDLRSKVEKRIEILGLDKKERDEYVTEALSDDGKMRFQEYLKEHPIINNYCYVPLYLVILLYLFQCNSLPESLTEMNKYFVFHTVVRHLKGLGKTPIKKFDDLLLHYPDFMKKLCSLAFDGLNDNRLVFSVDEIHFEINDDLFKNGFGLLQPLQYYTEEEGTFNFCHFTIQEFLAAYYISTLPIEQQSLYMNNTFWKDRFAYMWVMYVGILGVKNKIFTQFISEGKTYKNKTELKITGTIQKDKRKRLHLFQCYMEAKSRAEMPKLISSMFTNGEVTFNKVSLHPHNVSSLMFFMSTQSAIIPWKKLELQNSSLSDNAMNILEQFVVDNKDKIAKLEYINLSRNPVSPWCVYCAMISNCQVETLTLCASSMQDHLDIIRQSLQNTDKLRVLKLLDVNCGDLAPLENILQYGVTLNRLDLSWERNPKHTLLQTVRNNVTVSIRCDILQSNAWSNSSIDLSGKNISNHEALFLAFGLRNNTTLVKFDVSQNHISDDGAKAISTSLKENNKLSEFDVSKNAITDNGITALMETVQTTSNLQKLNISGLSISDSSAAFVGEQLKKNDKLLSLNMSNVMTTEEGAKNFLEAFCTNATLTILYIQNIDLSDNGMAALSACIRNNVLQELYISQNKITDTGLWIMANAVEINQSLCKLDISKNLISWEGIVYFLQKIADDKKSSLRHLCISHNNVTKSSWNYIEECIKNISIPMEIIASWNEIELESCISNLAKIKTTIFTFSELSHDHPTVNREDQFIKEIHSTKHRIRAITSCLMENNILTSINLSGVGITETEANTFSDVIRCNSVLRILNIAQNELGDQGIAVISKSLKENTTLHALNVFQNCIMSKGAMELAQALKDNKTLKFLDISSNFICDKGVVAILSSASNLKKLNLSNNKIPVKGAMNIANAIKENRCLKYLYLFQPFTTNEPTFHKTILNSIMHFNNTLVKLTLPWLDETLDLDEYNKVKLLIKEINKQREQSSNPSLNCPL